MSALWGKYAAALILLALVFQHSGFAQSTNVAQTVRHTLTMSNGSSRTVDVRYITQAPPGQLLGSFVAITENGKDTVIDFDKLQYASVSELRRTLVFDGHYSWYPPKVALPKASSVGVAGDIVIVGTHVGTSEKDIPMLRQQAEADRSALRERAEVRISPVSPQSSFATSTPQRPSFATPLHWSNGSSTTFQDAGPSFNTFRRNGGGSVALGGESTTYSTFGSGNISTTFGSDGASYNTYKMGNISTTFGSDGTSYNTYRLGTVSTTFGSNGTSYNTYRLGNISTTFGSDGTSYNTYRLGNGSTTFGSDGTIVNDYGR